MSMAQLPPVLHVQYNKTKYGYCGELGTGANAHLRFLQTALSSDELDSVTLIENVPGSETWDVRDLFQRDVDVDRVTRDILPYLKDKSKVKFFNPLTLALLPLSSDGQNIEERLPFVLPQPADDGGHHFTEFEWEGHYKFRRHDETPAFSYLSWNDRRVRIVAIDGQHRLSALKRWKLEVPESSKELSGWTIPVVILGIFKVTETAPAATFLEIVRRTFVYINSTAESIRPARKMLLNDESVNALCTQELVQDSHSNDCRPFADRDPAKMPLLCFDWRGEVQKDGSVASPAALKTVEEVYAWFENYLLQEDGGATQQRALGLEDLVPPLTTFGTNKTLSHSDAAKVRVEFRKTLLPGVQHCLQEFAPYKAYIQECRKLEEQALAESDLAQHAFMRMRFGTDRSEGNNRKLVTKRYDELATKFQEVKGKLFDELLVRDIGMRAVMYAFAYCKNEYDEDKGVTTAWLDYSRWFTGALNKIYTDGWFRSFLKLDASRRALMTHVVFDPAGSIINYKLEAQEHCFGALMSTLVFVTGKSGVKQETLDTVWDDCSEELKTPLKGGYRRQFKAQLAPSFRGKLDEFKQEVQKKANAAVERHVSNLKTFLKLS
jgi:hypothetical protein